MNGPFDLLETELLDLADACLSDEISDEQLNRLDSLVCQNSTARQIYLQCIQDGLRLRSWATNAQAAASLPVKDANVEPAVVDGQGSVVGAGIQQSQFPIPSSQSPILGFLGRTLIPFHRPIVWSILAVAVVFYGTFALFSWNLRSDKLPNRSVGNDVAVAMISGATDVRWSPDTKPQGVDAPIGRGGILKIDSGIVELQLKHGAKLFVEGPATWSIEGDNAVSLQHGKLVARVSPRAIGFTLTTPTTQIVDLGTEFGVEVNAAGQTDVEVIAGKVDVRYDSAAKSEGSRQSVQLTAGASRRFSSRAVGGGVSVTPITSWVGQTTLGKKLSGAHPELPAEIKYAAAVMADRPLGYWRFSDPDGYTAMDSSGHGHHGEYSGFVSTNNSGIRPNTSDRSARFLGKDYAGCVRINDFEVPASFTVEIWARSATPLWNGYGWLLSSAVPNGFEIIPLDAKRDWQFQIRNSRNEVPLLGPHGGPSDIADRFHQYVVSYDAAADRGAMFCDGVLVRETANLFGNSPRHETARLSLYVGCLDQRTPNPVWGEGLIDELAIYGDALTPDAVKRHYEAAGYATPNNSDP